MNLNTVRDHIPLLTRSDLEAWRPGGAWLAGGTWLFSEPQPGVDTLLDLATLQWAPIEPVSDGGVAIAATCSFATLYATIWAPEHRALSIVEACCHALLGSFKVWAMATVGGNICLALPAAPMVALATAMEGVARLWLHGGGERRVPVEQLVVGPGRTALAAGEVMRSLELPAVALRRRAAVRRASLTPGGRSAALLIGTADDDAFALTITASSPRPLRLCLPRDVSEHGLREAIDAALPTLAAYYDDVHGRPAWRRAMTHRLAQELRAELVDA